MPSISGEHDSGLTVTEVATVADVPTRYVYHIIDKNILPDALFAYDGGRRFALSVPFLVALDAALANYLTIDARKEVYSNFFEHCSKAVIFESKALLTCRWDEEWPAWPNMSALAEIWNPEVEKIPHEVRQRHTDLTEANVLVVRDPEILSGTPVIRGTRVPAYDIAASVEAGIDTREIADAYPAITLRDVELAHLWAKAHPPVGRPRAAKRETGKTRKVPRKKRT
jgi:uncharacterized protein (DUF433 family)